MQTKKNALLGKLCLTTLLVVSFWAAVACEGLVSAPEDCDERNTATLKFKNKSSHTTYRILLDGANIGTIKPGKFMTTTVTGGVHYEVDFIFANSGRQACSTANPAVSQCRVNELSCDAEE